MKYMLLAYTDRDEWAKAIEQWRPDQELPPEVQAACDFYEDLHKELSATGEFVATEGLADPSHTRTIRKVDDEVVATDGPFAESKEVLVSYAIVDCESYDRAVEIASRVVNAVGDTVEVRPIPGEEGVLEP